MEPHLLLASADDTTAMKNMASNTVIQPSFISLENSFVAIKVLNKCEFLWKNVPQMSEKGLPVKFGKFWPYILWVFYIHQNFDKIAIHLISKQNWLMHIWLQGFSEMFKYFELEIKRFNFAQTRSLQASIYDYLTLLSLSCGNCLLLIETEVSIRPSSITFKTVSYTESVHTIKIYFQVHNIEVPKISWSYSLNLFLISLFLLRFLSLLFGSFCLWRKQ